MAEGAAIDSAAILGKFLLFQMLDGKERAELAAHARRRRYAAGEPIFHVGDTGDSMMAIVTGTVRITLPTQGGKDVILGDLPAGELVGEIALLDGGGRSADVTALTNVEVLVIDRRDALVFLRAHPEICLQLLAKVCAKLRASEERASDLAHFDLGGRLAKAMLRLVEVNRNSGELRLSTSQGDLARMVGASREAVNRQLAGWQKRGIVEMVEGRIIVRAPEVLAGNAGLV
jgi:CRP-like cAMP-binding protein